MVFNDAGLVQYDATERAGVKTMQAVIVGDVDTVDDVGLIGALFDADTDVLPFLSGLLRYSKRRQNQNGPVDRAVHGICPCNLHATLAKPSVSENRRAALTQRPSCQCGLMREHRLW